MPLIAAFTKDRNAWLTLPCIDRSTLGIGEDLALLRASKAIVYRSGMTTPDSAVRKNVAAEGVRRSMRKTGLSQHTIEAIRQGLPVRHMTLERLLAAFRSEARALT